MFFVTHFKKAFPLIGATSRLPRRFGFIHTSAG
jgi:hypothetical protein